MIFKRTGVEGFIRQLSSVEQTIPRLVPAMAVTWSEWLANSNTVIQNNMTKRLVNHSRGHPLAYDELRNAHKVQ